MALEVEDEQIVWPGGSRLAVKTLIMKMRMMAPIIMRVRMMSLIIMMMTKMALMIMLRTTNRKTTTTTIIKRATLIITRKRTTAIIDNDFDNHNNINYIAMWMIVILKLATAKKQKQ